VHVGGNVVAAKGVLGDLNPLGDGPCRSLADSGASCQNYCPRRNLKASLVVGGLYSVTALRGFLGFLIVGCWWALFDHIDCWWASLVFFIVGGLYLVTALRENDNERVTEYTKHRQTLQSLVTEA